MRIYCIYIFRFAVCTRIPASPLFTLYGAVSQWLCASLSGQSKRTCLSPARRPDLITLTCGCHCYRWHPHISRQHLNGTSPCWNSRGRGTTEPNVRRFTRAVGGGEEVRRRRRWRWRRRRTLALRQKRLRRHTEVLSCPRHLL